MYRLQSLRPLHDLEDARKRYDDAVAMLTKVAAGELTLGLAADGMEPPLADKVESVQGPDRVFDPRQAEGLLRWASMLDAPWNGRGVRAADSNRYRTIEDAIVTQLRIPKSARSKSRTTPTGPRPGA